MNEPNQSNPAGGGDGQQPAPRPFPNQDFIRPGIDDRPDWDKALSDEDKAAVQRLAVRQKPRPARPAATRPEVQAAAMDSRVGGLDEPLPDAESAFLDLRDPMVDADGYRPTPAEVTRMKVGFALSAFFLSFALAALNVVLVPLRLDAFDGGRHGAVQLAWLMGIGTVMTLVATSTLLPLSDHTRIRFGRRTPWLVGGMVLSVLFTFALGACHTSVALTLVWAILQVGLAAMQFSLVASVGERVPDKFRDTVAGWRRVGLSAGLLLGVAAAALCMDDPGRGFTFAACSIALTAVCALLIVPRERSSVYVRVRPLTTADMTATLRVPHAPGPWYVACVARLLASAAIGVPVVFVWFLVRDVHGFDDPLALRETMIDVTAMAVVAYVCAALAEVALRPVYRRWEDDVRPPAAIAALLVAVAAACPWFLPTRTGFLLFAALCGFAMTVLDDLAQSLATGVIEQASNRGSYLAVLNTTDRCGKLLGIAAGGITIGMTGAVLPLFLVSAGFAVLTILCVVLVRQH